MAKNIDSRIMHKHDTEENWKKAVNFIPKAGELIIYDTDENHPFPRTKIGNGISKINELPFSSFSIENYRKTVSQENSMLRLSDISSDSHKVDIKLRSKNLIAPNDSYYAGRTVTRAGVTFTVNDDLSIHVKGSSTSAGDSWFSFTGFQKFAIDCSAGTYAVSNKVDGTVINTDGRLTVEGNFIKSDKTRVNCDLSYNANGSKNKIVTIDQPSEFISSIYVSSGIEVDCTVYFQLEKGTIATEYTPYVPDDAEITLTTCGKNLVKYPYSRAPAQSVQQGLTYTLLEDGGINVKGTCTGATTYTVGDWYYGNNGFIASYELYFDGVTSHRTWYRHWASAGTIDKTYYPQIEIGSVRTEYEPYKQGETITTTLADGAALASIYPNMSIISNIQGVVIEATYNSMHFDEKWNGLINSAVDSISNSDIDRLFEKKEVTINE